MVPIIEDQNSSRGSKRWIILYLAIKDRHIILRGERFEDSKKPRELWRKSQSLLDSKILVSKKGQNVCRCEFRMIHRYTKRFKQQSKKDYKQRLKKQAYTDDFQKSKEKIKNGFKKSGDTRVSQPSFPTPLSLFLYLSVIKPMLQLFFLSLLFSPHSLSFISSFPTESTKPTPTIHFKALFSHVQVITQKWQLFFVVFACQGGTIEGITLDCILRSKFWWFTEFCNSQ